MTPAEESEVDGRRQNFFLPGELPLTVLALLADQPRYGYQLMVELDRRFAPAYRSSAGSLYPALAALVDSKLVTARREATRKIFSVTPAGRSALKRRREALAAIEIRTGVRLLDGPDLDAVLDRFVLRVKALAGRLQPADAEALLDRVAEELADLAQTTEVPTDGA